MFHHRSPFYFPAIVPPKPPEQQTACLCGKCLTIVDIALCWYRSGFSVIPILQNCKATATKWDPWQRVLSEGKIRLHWRINSSHDIGFIVGDDTIVFDADTPEAVKTLYLIEKSHGIHSALVVKTSRGEHHYFRLASGTCAKTTGHGDKPEQKIDIKTGRTMVILPPSTGKQVILQTAKNASELTEVDQCFVDSVFLMIGKPVPRLSEPVSERPILAPKTGELATVVKLLQELDPDCAYTTWTKIGMAIFHTSGGSAEGLDLYDAWSSSGKKYPERKNVETKYLSFRLEVPRPVTIGTLFYIAKVEGIDVGAILEEKFEICETIVVDGGAK